MPMTPSAGVLSREQLAALLDHDPPLVAGLSDREAQLQPNGIDITLESIARFTGPGTLAIDNQDRRLADASDLDFEPDGYISLTPGAYIVRFTETVNLPVDLMAYLRPRSSLLRSGVALHTAVWDAGYCGRGASLLVVYNEHGFRVQRGARIGQLVFHRLAAATAAGYDGIYQGEATGPTEQS